MPGEHCLFGVLYYTYKNVQDCKFNTHNQENLVILKCIECQHLLVAFIK